MSISTTSYRSDKISDELRNNAEKIPMCHFLKVENKISANLWLVYSSQLIMNNDAVNNPVQPFFLYRALEIHQLPSLDSPAPEKPSYPVLIRSQNPG